MRRPQHREVACSSPFGPVRRRRSPLSPMLLPTFSRMDAVRVPCPSLLPLSPFLAPVMTMLITMFSYGSLVCEFNQKHGYTPSPPQKIQRSPLISPLLTTSIDFAWRRNALPTRLMPCRPGLGAANPQRAATVAVIDPWKPTGRPAPLLIGPPPTSSRASAACSKFECRSVKRVPAVNGQVRVNLLPPAAVEKLCRPPQSHAFSYPLPYLQAASKAMHLFPLPPV